MFTCKFANWIQFANGTKIFANGTNFREHDFRVRERAAFADGTEHMSQKNTNTVCGNHHSLICGHLASSVACIEISHLYTNRRRLPVPLFPFPFSSPSHPSLLPSLFPSLPAPPPTSVMNAQAGVAGWDASVGPAQLARAPNRSSQAPQMATVGPGGGHGSGGPHGGSRRGGWASSRMGLGCGGARLKVG